MTVQVAEINRIEIDDMYLTEAGEDEVLQQFAANATCSHHEDLGLRDIC